LSDSPVTTLIVSSVTLEQSKTGMELNGVVVLDSLKSGVIEVQWSSALAALSEILGSVRDVGLINSLQPCVIELLVYER
jgi:hypothetical protein